MQNDNEYFFTLNNLIKIADKNVLNFPLYIDNKKVTGWDIQCIGAGALDRGEEPFVSIHFFINDGLEKGYYTIIEKGKDNAE